MAQKIIIYQVIPRLFGNDNHTKIPNGTIKQNGCGKLSAFTPKALQEIKKMGITHIWFTGIIEHATQTDYSHIGITPDNPQIVKGKAGSPYAIKDYYDIHPDLADIPSQRMEEFERLIKRTHKEGLKAVIDFVPNHVARQYHSDAKPPHTADFGATDDNTQHFLPDNNFYYLPHQTLHLPFNPQENQTPYIETPAKATGNNCFSPSPGPNDWYETIKLNYGIDFHNGESKHFTPIPDTWMKMKQILLFWASKGVDAFRCDMAEMVPVEFWGWVIEQIKIKFPHIIFIAEIYNPQQYSSYIHHGRFDYLYDKVGLYDTLRNIITEQQPTSDITFHWQQLGELQPHMLNFLENHDEQRIASSFFAGNPQKAIPAMLIATTLNTNPVMIYFAQELAEQGMEAEGFSGKDGRTSIFDYWQLSSIENWRNNGTYNENKLSPQQRKIRQTYIHLLNLCHTEKAIREGKFFDLMYANYDNPNFDSTKQFAYLRSKDSDILLIASNFDSRPVDIHIHIPDEALAYCRLQPSHITGTHELLSDKKNTHTPFIDNHTITLHIDPHAGVIIKLLTK